MKTKILMLDKHDEEKEIEFHLEYLLSLTTKQRFKKLFEWSDFVKKLAAENENYRRAYRRTSEIIQRK